MSGLKIYGSDKCPDCPPALKILNDNNIEYEYINITDSLLNLKEFLNLRDNRIEFKNIIENGSVGIPCFYKNGNIYFEITDIL